MKEEQKDRVGVLDNRNVTDRNRDRDREIDSQDKDRDRKRGHESKRAEERK
jgi:hypothetical protein